MMTLREAGRHSPSLADQAQERTPSAAAEEYDHYPKHGLELLELAHIAIVAVAAAGLWF